MRATDLLPPILNERHSLRRHQRRGARAQAAAQAAGPTAPAAHTHAKSPAIQAPPAPFPAPSPAPALHADPAVERARAAGGPIDNACYACSCGFVFAAAVSTTVACPHCGADQGW
ncbi:MAG TPA: hypothetical protein VL972_06810 [Solirubrobacteraceae bacterium]|nr:hypothetical protein [Solirubrobacteraceae bacterium]